MTLDAAAEDALPDPSPLVALAFLTPWALVSLFLPAPWSMASLGLVTLLALLLLAAAAWSHHAARERGLDAAHWAFVTVLTLGVAMMPLALGRTGPDGGATYVCVECGRRAPMAETFCHGCGAA